MNTKMTHLDEYKDLRAEIMLYQREMHQTWLWAVIPAGAVYTWLSSHTKELGPAPLVFWLIPAALILLCFMRYQVFWYRIERLDQYQVGLEKEAFGEEKLCGVARWNRKPVPDIFEADTAPTFRDHCLHRVVKGRSLMSLATGAFWAWLLLFASSVGLSVFLWCRASDASRSESRVAPVGQIASPVLIYPAFSVSTSIAPLLTASNAVSTSTAPLPSASNAASSQPTNKP